MEAAGLAVGVVALVGMFKDCIDLFSYISAAKSLGRDYELTAAKLDIEKTYFLQWAENVGLMTPGPNTVLDDPTKRDTIGKTLASIKSLLGESEILRQRYGLIPTDEAELALGSPAFGSGRLERFIRDFEAMSLRMGAQRKIVSTPNKLRWAIIDKEKFEELIGQLTYFIGALHRIAPCTLEERQKMALDDAKNVKSLAQLRLFSKADQTLPYIDGQERQRLIHAAAEEEARLRERCYTRILNSIWFRTMDDRKEGVKPAYFRSLQWCFSSSEDLNWDSLPEWLSSGSGIYWLSGKAASGKSTTMKFLCTHPRTAELLGEWAGPTKLCMDSFFFWYNGSQEQKSLDGLWRALLFKVVSSDNDLIPHLLPSMWQEAYYTTQHEPAVLTSAEIDQAFTRLIKMENSNHKYCFFIDGFDEFTGRYTEGIRFLRRLAAPPHIKILVSSRPIQECQAAFIECPKLRLQDLTNDDISVYIWDKINTHPNFQMIFGRHQSQALQLARHMEQKASGVFLWVVLACETLSDGMTACDQVAELEKRVEELPPELEDLFLQMLQRVSPRYRQEAVQLLKIAFQHHGHRDWYAWGLPVIGLALLSQDYSKARERVSIRGPSEAELDNMCAGAQGRIRSRCPGLFDFSSGKDYYYLPHACNFQFSFIHKCLFEFLSLPQTWDSPKLLIQDHTFDPDRTLVQMYAAMLEMTTDLPDEVILTSYYRDQCFARYTHDFVVSLKWLNMPDDMDIIYFLDTLESLVRHYSKTHSTSLLGMESSDIPPNHLIVSIVSVFRQQRLLELLEKHREVHLLKVHAALSIMPQLRSSIEFVGSERLPVRELPTRDNLSIYLLSKGVIPKDDDAVFIPWLTLLDGTYSEDSVPDSPKPIDLQQIATATRNLLISDKSCCSPGAVSNIRQAIKRAAQLTWHDDSVGGIRELLDTLDEIENPHLESEKMEGFATEATNTAHKRPGPEIGPEELPVVGSSGNKRPRLRQPQREANKSNRMSINNLLL